jgi:microcystin-dependent protein
MATPVGIIIIWDTTISGSVIPTGWHICDGTSGTPDLRGFFVRGASSDSDVGTNAGVSSHTHTSPSLASAGGHIHNLSGSTGNNSNSVTNSTGTSGTVGATGTHSHSWGGSTNSAGEHTHTVGDSQSASAIPPYYKAYYIMAI